MSIIQFLTGCNGEHHGKSNGNSGYQTSGYIHAFTSPYSVCLFDFKGNSVTGNVF